MSAVAVASSRSSEYLLYASDEVFSSCLALLDELSLFNLMASKSAELIEKVGNKISKGTWAADSDHFQEKVIAKTSQFAALSRGERLLRTLGELQKLLGIQPRDFQTPHDLAEVADDICMSTVKLVQQNTKAAFVGADIDSLVRFQLAKIFGDLNVPINELSSDQQQTLVARVRDFLRSLPADQQKFIMDKIGAADLSDAAIRQAIASGAMWTAFAAAVQLFGFAFYTTAAHLLAIVSLHMLPFGAYVGLSSTVAVLSSPWMIPIFAGIGIWYYRRKNRGLRESMVPLILTSLFLSGIEGRSTSSVTSEARIVEALSLWSNARDARDQSRGNTNSARNARDESQSQLNATRRQLEQTKKRKDRAANNRRDLEGQLDMYVESSTFEIAQGRWGVSSSNAAAKVQEIQTEILRARQRRDRKTGFLGTVKAYLEYGMDAASLNGQLYSAKAELFQRVKINWSNDGNGYPETAAFFLRGMDTSTSEIIAAQGEIDRLVAQERIDSKALDDACAVLGAAQAEQTKCEQAYFGLGAV